MANVFDNNIRVDASGNVTIAGNLTVSGATNTISATNTVITDKLIELGNGVSGTPSGDAGIIIERGSSTNAAIIWDESADEFVLGTTSATGASTGDLTVTSGNVNIGNITAQTGGCVFGNGQAATISLEATAHGAVGKAISLSGGATTAGTTNNIAGGSVTINGGQGKGSGAGGDIIFKTANAGSSGSSLNALATALTLSDDTSATFDGAVIIKAPLASSGANGTFGTFADGDGTPSVGTGNLWKHHASTQAVTMFDDGIPGQVITVISTAAITYDVTGTNLKGGSADIVTADGDVTQWCFDGTNWYLLQFMDVTADHSTIGGGGGADANDLDHILHQQVFGR